MSRPRRAKGPSDEQMFAVVVFGVIPWVVGLGVILSWYVCNLAVCR